MTPTMIPLTIAVTAAIVAERGPRCGSEDSMPPPSINPAPTKTPSRVNRSDLSVTGQGSHSGEIAGRGAPRSDPLALSESIPVKASGQHVAACERDAVLGRLAEHRYGWAEDRAPPWLNSPSMCRSRSPMRFRWYARMPPSSPLMKTAITAHHQFQV